MLFSVLTHMYWSDVVMYTAKHETWIEGFISQHIICINLSKTFAIQNDFPYHHGGMSIQEVAILSSHYQWIE